jgi:hypothetical protein
MARPEHFLETVSDIRDNAPGTDVKGPHGMDAPEPRLWTGAPERGSFRRRDSIGFVPRQSGSCRSVLQARNAYEKLALLN